MGEGRITPVAVASARDVIDEDDRRTVGNVVVSLGFTSAAVKDLLPREWEELAAYLFSLLEREPLKSRPAYTGQRIVIGSLATELRGFAAAAGEPIGLEADLRHAASQADERRIRERIADQEAAYDRHIDEVIASSRTIADEG